MAVVYCTRCNQQELIVPDDYVIEKQALLCSNCIAMDQNEIDQEYERNVRNEETAQYLQQDPDINSSGSKGDYKEVDSLADIGS